MWKGVVGGGRGASDCERMRGVALSVPHVISCLTAAGPSSDGVGEGMLGMKEKLFIVGDLGRSMATLAFEVRQGIWDLQGVPVMAAFIRLRVGLGGAEVLRESVDSSCSGRRVLLYLMALGSPRALLAAAEPDVSCGVISASGANIREFLV